MVEIVAYGAYVPRLRLQPSGRLRRQQVVCRRPARPRQGRALDGQLGRGFDHHGGRGLARLPDSHKAEDVRSLYFASTTHPFKDRQNAGVIGTALIDRAESVGLRRRRLAEGRHLGADRRPQRLEERRRPGPGRGRRQAPGARRLVERAELRRRRRGAAVRHRERDRQAGRPSLGVDGFRRSFPRRRDRLRLRLGRALDPRRGLLEDRAARRQGRRSPPASSRAPTSPSSSCRA